MFRAVLAACLLLAISPAGASRLRIGTDILITRGPDSHLITRPRTVWWGHRTDRVRFKQTQRFSLGKARLYLHAPVSSEAHVKAIADKDKHTPRDLVLMLSRDFVRAQRYLYLTGTRAILAQSVIAGLGFEPRLAGILPHLPAFADLLGPDVSIKHFAAKEAKAAELGLALTFSARPKRYVALEQGNAGVVMTVLAVDGPMVEIRSRIKLVAGQSAVLSNVWRQPSLELAYDADPAATQ